MTDRALRVIEKVLLLEGSFYVEDDQGRGGSKYGLTKKSYPDLKIKQITRKRAIEIYYHEWWLQFKFSLLPEKVDAVVFLAAVNTGNTQASKFLQRALRSQGFNLVDDGIIGQLTLGALSRCKIPELITAYRSEQAGFYRLLVTEDLKRGKFLKGWPNRAYKEV